VIEVRKGLPARAAQASGQFGLLVQTNDAGVEPALRQFCETLDARDEGIAQGMMPGALAWGPVRAVDGWLLLFGGGHRRRLMAQVPEMLAEHLDATTDSDVVIDWAKGESLFVDNSDRDDEIISMNGLMVVPRNQPADLGAMASSAEWLQRTSRRGKFYVDFSGSRQVEVPFESCQQIAEARSLLCRVCTLYRGTPDDYAFVNLGYKALGYASTTLRPDDVDVLALQEFLRAVPGASWVGLVALRATHPNAYVPMYPDGLALVSPNGRYQFEPEEWVMDAVWWQKLSPNHLRKLEPKRELPEATWIGTEVTFGSLDQWWPPDERDVRIGSVDDPLIRLAARQVLGPLLETVNPSQFPRRRRQGSN